MICPKHGENPGADYDAESVCASCEMDELRAQLGKVGAERERLHAYLRYYIGMGQGQIDEASAEPKQCR